MRTRTGCLWAITLLGVFLLISMPSVLAPPARFEGTVVLNGTNFTANGAPVSAHINTSNIPVITRNVGAEGANSGYFIIDLFCQSTDNVTFKVYNISVNGSTPQTCPSSASPVTGMTLYLNKTPNTATCYYNLSCASGGFCVHNICRSASTFCGDGFCDSGETTASCSADCPNASTSPGGGGTGGGGRQNQSQGGGQNQSQEKSNNPEIVPGVGLRDNEKLQEAIENALGKTLDQAAIDNLLRISEAISSDIDAGRKINVGSGQSTITTTIKYTGDKNVVNFIIYENVPKTFADSASKISVTATGAVIKVVNQDPEYSFTYPEVTPNQELTITYNVNSEVSTNVIDTMTTEVYGESLEDITQPPGGVCTPGEKACSGNDLQECNAEGTGWTTLETCQYGCSRNECLAPGAGLDYTYVWIIVAIIIVVVIVGLFAIHRFV